MLDCILISVALCVLGGILIAVPDFPPCCCAVWWA